jgi:hypothetical protein
MREFALMNGDTVVNIVLTNKTKEQVERTASEGYKVVPIEMVPRASLTRYKYWKERS